MLHYGDLTDATNLIRIIQEVQPTRSIIWRHKVMWSLIRDTEYTANSDGIGTLRVLEPSHSRSGEESPLLSSLDV